jgi:cell division protein FtsL
LNNVDLPPALGMLVAAAIFALVCIFYLNQVTALSNANYELQRLQTEHSQLVQEGADLRLQIARSQSLTSIEAAARARLGMVPIGDRYTYLNITDGPLTAMPPLPTPVVPGEEAAQPSP